MQVFIGNGPDSQVFWKALDFAVEAHGDQWRRSGDPYIMHPCSVAKILAEELDIRGDTLIEGLLLDLQQIDRRITAVVGAANAVFSTLIPREPPPTYSATGRLRGGAA